MTNLFPMIQPQTHKVDSSLPLYREVAWDFAKGKPLFRRGEPVYVTGREAVKVWVWKALKTQRTRYEIYSWDFGNEVEELVGQNYTEQLKQAEAKRYVREALLANPYITEVSGIKVGFSDGKLTIEAQVHTIYGEVDASV